MSRRYTRERFAEKDLAMRRGGGENSAREDWSGKGWYQEIKQWVSSGIFTLMLRVVGKAQMTLELASSKTKSSRISSRV